MHKCITDIVFFGVLVIAEKFWLSEIMLVVIMTIRYVAVIQKQISAVRMYFWNVGPLLFDFSGHLRYLLLDTRSRSRDPSEGGL